MATFKEISDADIKTSKSFLNQLVDVLQLDISGSATRKKYQVYVTGGIGPGITSSLFQTVHDQDFGLQTSNPIFDLTVGIFSGSADVMVSTTGTDTSGKVLFPSNSLMMREKISNYRQMAQQLLGSADLQFTAPFSNASESDKIDHAMFVCFKRLFARDLIKRESFAMKIYSSASHQSRPDYGNETRKPNLAQTSESGSVILTDVGSSANIEQSFGGEVGNVVFANNTTNKAGVLFYEQGIGVFDLSKIISGSQHVSGVIDAMNNNNPEGVGFGKTLIGSPNIGKSANVNAKFIPDLMVSGSIDNIIEHLASCRFGSGSLTAVTFQNLTKINSTLIFCRATADQFNYSSNPTYVDSTDNRIRVIDKGQESTQKAFSFITTVGLYDSSDNLLAVAKLSRPVEKNDEKDITFRIRLDF